jgi:hypothetical protein
MAIDVAQLVGQMINAAAGVLGKKWPDVKEYAESEFKKLGECILTIESMKLQGKITEDQARLHIEIQKNAMRTVMLTVEGLGILAVEQAINAAFVIVRNTVNTALGWKIL